MDRISRPRKITMRSLAAPIIIAPEADSMASTWNSGPSDPLALQIAIADEGGEQHGDGHHDLDEHVEAVEGDGAGDGHLRSVGADRVPLVERGHQGGDRHRRGDDRPEADRGHPPDQRGHGHAAAGPRPS